MNIPDKEECFRLIHEMRMMDHIVAHSIQVSRVALFLTDHLAKRNGGLNRELIRASALLHDITKTRSFETGENHAATGEDFLRERGYGEVARIVGQHVRLDRYMTTGSPTETEIVNYADKRVLHDKVVPLRERLDYILEKYGKGPEILARIRQTWEKTNELESKIFRGLPFLPHEIDAFLSEESLSHEVSEYLQTAGF